MLCVFPRTSPSMATPHHVFWPCVDVSHKHDSIQVFFFGPIFGHNFNINNSDTSEQHIQTQRLTKSGTFNLY